VGFFWTCSPPPGASELGTAPRQRGIRQLLARRSGRALGRCGGAGARASKQSRFSPVSAKANRTRCPARRCSSRASRPAPAGVADPACARLGQESRKSPDSVRFLHFVDCAGILLRVAGPACLRAHLHILEITMAPHPPGCAPPRLGRKNAARRGCRLASGGSRLRSCRHDRSS